MPRTAGSARRCTSAARCSASTATSGAAWSRAAIRTRERSRFRRSTCSAPTAGRSPRPSRCRSASTAVCCSPGRSAWATRSSSGASDLAPDGSGEDPAPEVSEAEGEEDGGEPDDDRVDDVQVHVIEGGEGGPHPLVHVDEGVEQDERLEPREPTDLDRRQGGPRVVGPAEEGDRQDDEAEHEPDVAGLEARPEHEPEAGH